MESLTNTIKKKAQTTGVVIQALKPNSKMIAQRMVQEGQLIKDGNVWRWHEQR